MSCPVAKAVGLEHIGNAPIEALDHAVGLRRPRLGQAVLDAQGLTQLIKLMRSTGLALSAAKQTVSELFSVVCQQLADFDRARLVQRLQPRWPPQTAPLMAGQTAPGRTGWIMTIPG